MTKIFISYRRSDDPYAARSINDALCRKFDKQNIYFDLDALQAGLDFREQIDAMVAKCDVMLVVIGDRWLEADDSGRSRLEKEDDLVLLEVSSALTRKIPVIPILVGKATIPSKDSLPDEIKSLVYRQAVEVRATANFGAQVERLLLSIEAVVREVKARMEELEEEAAWRKAKKQNTLHALKTYVRNYPDGKFIEEANQTIQRQDAEAVQIETTGSTIANSATVHYSTKFKLPKWVYTIGIVGFLITVVFGWAYTTFMPNQTDIVTSKNLEAQSAKTAEEELVADEDQSLTAKPEPMLEISGKDVSKPVHLDYDLSGDWTCSGTVLWTNESDGIHTSDLTLKWLNNADYSWESIMKLNNISLKLGTAPSYEPSIIESRGFGKLNGSEFIFTTEESKQVSGKWQVETWVGGAPGVYKVSHNRMEIVSLSPPINGVSHYTDVCRQE